MIGVEMIECPNHEGNFDCTPFCAKCGGEQEYSEPSKVCGVDGCDYPRDGMMPNHKASERCKSAKKPHCTCDTCY